MTPKPCGAKFTGYTPEGLAAQPLCTRAAGHDGHHRTRGVMTAGGAWCLDCGSAVLVLGDLLVCSGCDREAPAIEAPA